MTSEEKTRILEKVVKCFALANDKGATEQEAASAAAMAQSLLEKYNLSQVDVKNLKKEEAIKAYYLFAQSRWQGWEVIFFASLAQSFDCFPYIHTSGGKKNLTVVGFKVDVEVFKYTFEFLRKTIFDLGTKDLFFAKERGVVRTKQQSYDYKFSFCSGCSSRITEIIKESRLQRFSVDVKTRDLVVVRNNEVTKWVDDNLSLKGARSVNLGGSSYAKLRGRQAAEGIQLRPAIKE